MRISVFAGVVALGLFVAYFAPIVLKLKELPLAVVVIGGQTLSLALTLIVTPVVYSLLDDLIQSQRARRWFSALRALFSRRASRDRHPVISK